MNVLFQLSVGVAKNFVYEVIRTVQFIFVERIFISLTDEELFFLNQENSYVMFN